MSQSKRQKMDPDAACSSSASVDTHEMSTSVPDGGEAPVAQQTAPSASQTNKKQKAVVIFNPTRNSFKEAVKWSGFVDRTLLIEELLNREESVIIFAPKRFGKSLNLKMVECFLQIEKGRDISDAPNDLKELEELENYKIFRRCGLAPCKILAKTDLVKEHFGRHPVIHLDFKNVEVSSVQDVKDGLRALIHKAYREHRYLMNGDEYFKGDCQIWCNKEKYKKERAGEGLQELIEYLHAYHGRKVYLLVDEFDAPTVKALIEGKSGNEVRAICNVVANLIGAAVKGDSANCLLGSLITGVSYLGSAGISDHFNNLETRIYKWLLEKDGRFYGYYGLRDDELTTLLEHVFPDDKDKRDAVRTEVKTLYNGYYFKDKAVYCLWSVLHYIQERKEKDVSEITETSFWGGSNIISEMAKILKNKKIMKIMLDLMGEGYTSFEPCVKVDATVLADFFSGKVSVNEDFVMTFFMEQGYVSRVSPEKSVEIGVKDGQVCVKVPNKDVLVGFIDMFKNFSLVICGLDNNTMQECADIVKGMSNESIDDGKLRKLHDKLNKLLSVLEGRADLNERCIQGAMWVAMLKADFKYCVPEKRVTMETEERGKFGMIDLWMFDENFAVIWEFKHRKIFTQGTSPEAALKQIVFGSESRKVPYVKILKQNEVKKYLLIGLSMDIDCKVDLCYLVDSQDFNNCISFP